MGMLLDAWNAWVEEEMPTAEAQQLRWADYYKDEGGVYEKILEEKRDHIEGSVTSLAEEFGLDPVMVMGFLDGINTSLKKELKLEKIKDDTDIVLDIDWEKLYFNMHKAKAPWLYNIKAWDDILTRERRKEIVYEYRQSVQATSNKIGRNDPCPCGSGKKYKKCCGASA